MPSLHGLDRKVTSPVHSAEKISSQKAAESNTGIVESMSWCQL